MGCIENRIHYMTEQLCVVGWRHRASSADWDIVAQLIACGHSYANVARYSFIGLMGTACLIRSQSF